MSVCHRPAETELKSKCCAEHLSGWTSCILTFSGLAHSRFPQSILFHLAPRKASLAACHKSPDVHRPGQVSRKGCNLPRGPPGAPSKRPRGTHRFTAPRLGCVAGRTPGCLQAADLHWHPCMCAAWRTPQQGHGSVDFSVMQRAP